jgi:hypothetical protein
MYKFFSWIFFLGYFIQLPTIQAQIDTSYQPMAVEGAHWIMVKYYEKPWGDEYYSLTIRGDTLYNGRIYKKMYKDDFFIDHTLQRLSQNPKVIRRSLVAMIRDEPARRRVWGVILPLVFGNTCPVYSETILFDFSSKVGDTLIACTKNQPRGAKPATIDSITYTKINCNFIPGNQSYRTLNVGGIWTTLGRRTSIKILEKIGHSERGPIYDSWYSSGGLLPEGEGGGGLRCYCVGSDQDCNISTSTRTIDSKPIGIFPNPVSSRLYFDLDGIKQLQKLEIFHVNGQLIRQYPQFQSLEEGLDISNLSKGTYFIRAQSQDGYWYRAKFVKL